MFDDFFIRALVAGIGVAFVTGPLGCFVHMGVTFVYQLDPNCHALE